MSDASELIGRIEWETGRRVDDGGDNAAMDAVFGAMSRVLGQSPSVYRERDDVAAGALLRHQMTPAYQREQKSKEALANMLLLGFSPDDVVTRAE